MPRRGENIRKRKDGRWEARIIVAYDQNGRAKYHSLYGRTYQEVRARKQCFAAGGTPPAEGRPVITAKTIVTRRETDADPAALPSDPPDITFSRVMEEWLDSRKDTIKESTYAHYYLLIHRHLLPELGGKQLAAITAGDLNIFLRKKLHTGRIDGNGGLSAKTVSDLRSVLIQGLIYATQQNYPCMSDARIFYPKNQQPHMTILTREQQQKLEQILFSNPVPLHLGILIALYGGLRIGELCSLQWDDCHLDSGTIQISKTIMRIPNLASDAAAKTKVIIETPKTDHSRRIIPLPSFLMTLLKEYQKDDGCYILTGTPRYMEPRLCLNKYKKLLNAAGLPSFTFHVLRHTFATRCVESDFDTKSLSEILGHSNVTITMQRYVHPSMERKREQMERLERLSIPGQ